MSLASSPRSYQDLCELRLAALEVRDARGLRPVDVAWRRADAAAVRVLVACGALPPGVCRCAVHRDSLLPEERQLDPEGVQARLEALREALKACCPFSSLATADASLNPYHGWHFPHPTSTRAGLCADGFPCRVRRAPLPLQIRTECLEKFQIAARLRPVEGHYPADLRKAEADRSAVCGSSAEQAMRWWEVLSAAARAERAGGEGAVTEGARAAAAEVLRALVRHRRRAQLRRVLQCIDDAARAEAEAEAAVAERLRRSLASLKEFASPFSDVRGAAPALAESWAVYSRPSPPPAPPAASPGAEGSRGAEALETTGGGDASSSGNPSAAAAAGAGGGTDELAEARALVDQAAARIRAWAERHGAALQPPTTSAANSEPARALRAADEVLASLQREQRQLEAVGVASPPLAVSDAARGVVRSLIAQLPQRNYNAPEYSSYGAQPLRNLLDDVVNKRAKKVKAEFIGLMGPFLEDSDDKGGWGAAAAGGRGGPSAGAAVERLRAQPPAAAAAAGSGGGGAGAEPEDEQPAAKRAALASAQREPGGGSCAVSSSTTRRVPMFIAAAVAKANLVSALAEIATRCRRVEEIRANVVRSSARRLFVYSMRPSSCRARCRAWTQKIEQSAAAVSLKVRPPAAGCRLLRLGPAGGAGGC